MSNYEDNRAEIEKALFMGRSVSEKTIASLSRTQIYDIAAWLASENIGLVKSKGPEVGQRIHGYANGYFGRDSYSCRTIVWTDNASMVTVSDSGVREHITITDFRGITDPNNRDHCSEECESWGK